MIRGQIVSQSCITLCSACESESAREPSEEDHGSQVKMERVKRHCVPCFELAFKVDATPQSINEIRATGRNLMCGASSFGVQLLVFDQEGGGPGGSKILQRPDGPPNTFAAFS